MREWFRRLAWALVVGSEIFSLKAGSLQDHASYVRRSWGTERGLPQSSVTSIVQTKDGYLWLGTLGGLARFDGINFTVFDSTNTTALKSSRIRALYEDGRGNLWIGTEHGGVTKYRDGIFRNFSLNEGLPSSSVISLAGDGAAGLIAGTTDGLARLAGARFIPLETESPAKEEVVSALYFDGEGGLWAGTDSDGLIRIHGGRARHYFGSGVAGPHSNAARLNRIAALTEDRQGTIWIGTQDGLVRLSAGTFSVVNDDEGRSIGTIRALYRDPDGVVWVGAWRGLYRLVGDRLVLFNRISQGGDNLVRSLLTDREGNLWAGTEAEGLEQWRRSNMRWFGRTDGLTDQPTASIYGDKDGTIWIGSLGGGLFRYRQGHFEHFDGSGHEWIRSPASIAGSGQKDLWLGDWDEGLLRVKANRVEKVDVPGLNGMVIRSELVDSRGILWIGTDHRGLYKYEKGQFVHYQKSDGLLGEVVGELSEDRAGLLWLAFPEGVSCFDGTRFTNYVHADLQLVRSIYQDSDGSRWIGTYGHGLFRLKAGRLSHVTTKDGLPEAVVSYITADSLGNLWMSGNRGIHRCGREELNDLADGRRADVRCVSYGAQDGLATSETNGVGQPAGFRALDGKLWFPLVKGVALVDPEMAATPAIPVVIEQVRLDDAPVSKDLPLRIPPSAKSLQIDYAALGFMRPEQERFRYRLEQVDKTWRDAGTRRTVVYDNLPPGSYQFRVIADNGFGVWNTSGAALKFAVVPPFWRTTWFAALALLGVTGAAGLLHQFRLGQLRRAHATQQKFSEMLIESQERERQRIAAEIHDGLGQSLLIIKNRAFLAKTTLRDEEVTAEQLEEISSTAAEAIDEVRAMAYDLHPFRLDRFGLTKALLGICVQAAETSGIRIETDIDSVDDAFSKEAERSIFRVVQEAVANIIKHSQAERARVAFKQEKDQVTISIEDDGLGFDSMRNDPSAVGGFGSVGMAERIRILGGSYAVRSAPGKGTSILIRLPI